MNPIVTMKIKDRGTVKIELYKDLAPNTVKNFISLIDKNFYDGLTFHRIIKGFMIQGGCPEGTGMGNPGYSIKGEFAKNGFRNDLKHTEGVLSMARAMSPDSAGSQFFLMTESAPHLDGSYAAFGKVIEGIEFVHDVENVKTNYNDAPLVPEVIESMTVDTNGEAIEEPEIIEY